MIDAQYLELLDWRRSVAELFAELRRRAPDADTLTWFRAQKDGLFKEHPQSPIPWSERPTFSGLAYWPLDPTMRVIARFVEDSEPSAGHAVVERAAAAGEIAFHRIGRLEFELAGQQIALPAFWIDGYAGGLFVPFKDVTSGHETYGGGRYLLDTIKSADLGSGLARNTVVLDFNYAYHPSCTYDPRWICPLAPPDSRVALPIRAGERLT